MAREEKLAVARKAAIQKEKRRAAAVEAVRRETEAYGVKLESREAEKDAFVKKVQAEREVANEENLLRAELAQADKEALILKARRAVSTAGAALRTMPFLSLATPLPPPTIFSLLCAARVP